MGTAHPNWKQDHGTHNHIFPRFRVNSGRFTSSEQSWKWRILLRDLIKSFQHLQSSFCLQIINQILSIVLSDGQCSCEHPIFVLVQPRFVLTVELFRHEPSLCFGSRRFSHIWTSSLVCFSQDHNKIKAGGFIKRARRCVEAGGRVWAWAAVNWGPFHITGQQIILFWSVCVCVCISVNGNNGDLQHF